MFDCDINRPISMERKRTLLFRLIPRHRGLRALFLRTSRARGDVSYRITSSHLLTEMNCEIARTAIADSERQVSNTGAHIMAACRRKCQFQEQPILEERLY